MTTMTATAIITAIDRASAVFARVGAAAQAQARHFRAGTVGLNRFTSATGAAVGAGGLLAASLSMEGEKQIDHLSRLTHSAGELTVAQREMLKRSALDASLKTGQRAIELLEAQQELVQGNIDPTTIASLTETFAKVARANAIETKKVAADAINVANALGFAMGTTEEKVASMTRAMEFMSVVPNLSTESWEGLRTALKHVAPTAGALKIPVEQLGAALSILADAGFKGEEAGTALRTILVRAQAPTRQARLEMRAAGIDLERLYTFDKAKLADGESLLAERLRGAGLGQGVDLAKAIAEIGDPSKLRGVYEFQDRAQQVLMKHLDIKKGDAEARGILNKAILGHINAATLGFDLETYFRGINKLPVQAMKEMFGLQRISQAIKLREEINKVLELADGTKTTKLENLWKRFRDLMPGSIDRRAEPVLEGFAFAVDRAAAALARLRNAIFEAGAGAGLTNALTVAATAIERFANTNPQALRDITVALAGLAAVGVGGFAFAKIAAGLGAVAAAAARLGTSRFLMAGGFAGLLFGDLGKLFETRHDPYGENPPTSPYLELRESMGGLFGEIAATVKAASAAVDALYSSIRGMFGFDGSGSLLVDSIKLIDRAAQGAASSIRFARETVESLVKGKELPKFRDYLPEWSKGWYDDYRLMMQGLEPRPALAGPGQPQSAAPRDGATFSDFFPSYIRRWLTDFDGSMRRWAPQLPPEPRQIPTFSGGSQPADRVRPDGAGSFSAQRVDVQGQADVRVTNEITVRVEGPGTVTNQTANGGQASVPLNPGRSMPDAQ